MCSLPRFAGAVRRPRAALAAGLLIALLAGAAALAADAPGPRPRATGVPVQVTPEMLGAGIVSSGTVLPPLPPLTGNRQKPVPSWGKPLPYPIVIADRRNNRLIEVAPDKRIVWEFPSPNLTLYRGNEDVNFSADGRQLAVSEEDNYDLHLIDYEQRAITWTYGVPDTRGSTGTLLNYPDDAHLLADGKFLTADIRNCRVLIFDPKTGKPSWEYFRAEGKGMLDHPSIARELPDTGDVLVVDDLHDRVIVIDRQTQEIIWQYGVTGVKGHLPGYLNYPDGVDLDVFRDWRRSAPGLKSAR